MADLVSGAVLGAVVGALLAEVIDKIRGAYRCKGNCKKLESTLHFVEPYVKKMADRGTDTCRMWLEDLKGLLEEAEQVINKYCILEKRTLIRSGFVYLKRSRVNSLILDIHDRIKEKIVNANMPIYDLVQAIHEKVMTRKSPSIKTSGFVPQDLPANIVSFENDTYEKLKTLIKTEGAGIGDPVTVGLRGAGGAGKTLLAKMLHNDPDIQVQYGAHSILWMTIGQDAKPPSLYLTMGKFLKDGVFERDYASRNEEDQRTYLIDAFKKKKVLLILDDVWEQYSHGHSIMERLDVAKGLGSVTLVTTRNNSVLTSAKAKEIVVVPLLSERKGWKLFCYQAFGTGSPPQGQIGEIAKDICKECRGLPLALAVIGGTMYDEKELWQWKYALNNLKQSKGASIPLEEELFHRLKFSYDKLDDVKKKCFLYFAAYPEDFEIPTHRLCSIWQAEQLFVDCIEEEEASYQGMATLINLADQSLIELSENAQTAKIHDVLRDLAICIIREAKPGDWASECYFQPGKYLKTIPEFPSTIKRISLIGSTIQNFPDHFKVRQLQVLLLSRVYNEDHISLRISKLFFRGITNLLYLDLSYTSLMELPESIKELKALTSLDLLECYDLKKLPESIKDMKALRSLNLTWCTSLKELPVSIKGLEALTSLDLSDCLSLKELPESIKELKALTSLNLSNCRSLEELPESFKELKVLTSLNLSQCTSLKELPESIKELNALISLNLSDCSSLKKLPKSFKELKALKSLDLSWCSSLKELPESIKELKALSSLNLSWCISLKELPESISNLKALISLDLSGCSSLMKLPESIKELKALSSLNLAWCSSLKELPESIMELKALGFWNLSRCPCLKKLPKGIKELKALHP